MQVACSGLKQHECACLCLCVHTQTKFQVLALDRGILQAQCSHMSARDSQTTHLLPNVMNSHAGCRQLAAGDQLRVVYAQLSQDPNSLSNLDQDLPNYAQHSVPIFSLPQVSLC